MKERFCVALVTYGDRGSFLRQVVSSCIEAGAESFIIVDNDSSNATKLLIENLRVVYCDIGFLIINNSSNMGSALAFSQAMDVATTHPDLPNWILFLDDDNVAEHGAIQKALYIASSPGRDGARNVYFLLRADRAHYVKYVETLDDAVLLGERNSFMAFSLYSYIRNRLFSRRCDDADKENIDDLIPAPCGPYGGMLISRVILSKGARPNKNMYLYFDDTDYTINLKRAGNALWILPGCKLHDIENSWSSQKVNNKFSSPLFEGNDYQVRFSVRNRIFFERLYLVDSYLAYIFNMTALLLILFLKSIISRRIMKYLNLYKYIFEGFRFNG